MTTARVTVYRIVNLKIIKKRYCYLKLFLQF